MYFEGKFLVKTPDGKLAPSEEYLEALDTLIFGNLEKIPVHIVDVGEYSIVLQERLFLVHHICIKRAEKTIKAIETIETPGGSIVYFDCRIDDYFKKDTIGSIYCRGAGLVYFRDKLKPNNNTLWQTEE